METSKDEQSEVGESEDIPSDFFDDFNRDEFMEGLSVIDECWEDVGGNLPQSKSSWSRINAEALDSVKDLRELIGESSEEDRIKHKRKPYYVPPDNKYRWKRKSPSQSNLDDFIKPGSRRDPSKTNEAIKKDKEVKVQQFLAKSLESSDDLRPPGTELDDYYEENKRKEPSITEKEESLNLKESRAYSPQRPRNSPRNRHSPRMRRSPREYVHHNPRFRHSPHASPRRRMNSPPHFMKAWNNYHHRKFSPPRHFRRNFSPQRRHSPRRFSPGRRSPRRQNRSRSPRRRRRSHSRSRSRSRSPRREDTFLYPNNSEVPPQYPHGNPSYQPELGQGYTPPVNSEFPGNVPGYAYQQIPAYGSGFPDPYNYGVPQAPMPGIVMPNVVPVATPIINPVPAPPPMVPAPTLPSTDKATPYDALAQLVAEGKISQEDYLKLTPNKGVATTLDTKTRVMVLTRCSQALSKLGRLLLPNQLMVNSQMIGVDDKYIAPKYCSPLKRQAVTEFSFSKGSVSPAQQTKHLVDSIISTLGMDKVVSKYRKKLPKDMKDAVIQTTKLQCEVCEIRESTKYVDVGTSTEPEYFTSTVHTQVVEQDLVSSKNIFNPSGSVGDGAPISIAHLTPAQLVSQLAARAKTLKQPQEPPPPQNQFSRRPPPNYDYDGRGGQYHHYNNYRY